MPPKVTPKGLPKSYKNRFWRHLGPPKSQKSPKDLPRASQRPPKSLPRPPKDPHMKNEIERNLFLYMGVLRGFV